MRKFKTLLSRASLLVLTAMVLMGLGQAKAETVTFKFEGLPTNTQGMDFQLFKGWETDLTQNIVNGEITASYTTQASFLIGVNSGYEITVTPPAGLTENTDYAIFEYPDTGYGVMTEITMMAGADGSVFTINLSEEGSTDEPVVKNEVTFNFEGPEAALSAFTFMNVTSYENLKPGMTDGTVTVKFDNSAYLMISISDKYEILVTPPANLDDETYVITPGTPNNGQTYTTIQLYPGANGATFNVILSEVGPVAPPEDEDASVTFKFKGTPEAMATLEVMEGNTFEPLQGGIVDGSLTLYYQQQGSYYFQVDDPYTIKVEAPEGLVENTDYAIYDMGTGYGAYVVQVIVMAGANNSVFTVTVAKEGEEIVEYLEEGTMIDPVVNGNGQVEEKNFNNLVGITWNYQPLKIASYQDAEFQPHSIQVPMAYATVINPEGESFSINGTLAPYDPSSSEDEGSTEPEGSTSGALTVLSFSISDATKGAKGILLGEYQVILTEGLVKNEAGEINPAQTFKFTIIGEPEYMEPGTMIYPIVNQNDEVDLAEMGMNFSVTYGYQPLTLLPEDDDDDYVIATILTPAGEEELIGGSLVPYDPSIYDPGATDPDVVAPAGETVLSFNILSAVMPDFPMSMDIALGEYVVTIPAGVVANQDGELNIEQTFKFTIVEGIAKTTSVTFAFEGDKDAMKTLEIYDYLNYEYIEDQIENDRLTVSFTNGISTFRFSTSEEYEVTIVPPSYLEADVDYVLYPGNTDPATGMYYTTIELYDGANESVFRVIVSEAGAVLPEPGYEATFVFSAPEDFDMADLLITALTDPEEMIQDGIIFDKLTVYFDTTAEFRFAVPADYTISIVAPEGLVNGEDYSLPMEGEIEGDYYTQTISLMEGADKAVFTVEIAEAPDNSVNAISAADANTVIYNINGMVVKRNASQDDVKALENGIYIINGKKIVVCK